MSGYGWIADGDEWPQHFTQNDIISVIQYAMEHSTPTVGHTYIADIDGIRVTVPTKPDGTIRSAYPAKRKN